MGTVSEPERLVAGSLKYVQAVAAALPVDAEDERVIDMLMEKSTGRLATRPLRKREGDPR